MWAVVSEEDGSMTMIVMGVSDQGSVSVMFTLDCVLFGLCVFWHSAGSCKLDLRKVMHKRLCNHRDRPPPGVTLDGIKIDHIERKQNWSATFSLLKRRRAAFARKPHVGCWRGVRVRWAGVCCSSVVAIFKQVTVKHPKKWCVQAQRTRRRRRAVHAEQLLTKCAGPLRLRPPR